MRRTSVWPGVPSPGALHCWHARLDLPPAARQACEAVLDGDELARAGRYAHAQLRWRGVAARGQLRLLLAAYTGLPAAALRFAYGPRGKPALPAAPALHFNLSHSEHRMVVGVAGAALGVDLECVDGGVVPAGLGTVLSHAEQTYVRQGPPTRFFECWTRKEACVKASGGGIDGQLHQLDTTRSRVGSWRLHTHAGPGWVLSVAAQPGCRLSHHTLAWRPDGAIDGMDLTFNEDDIDYA
jgi:4'-phosphopantetheinyl transferase